MTKAIENPIIQACTHPDCIPAGRKTKKRKDSADAPRITRAHKDFAISAIGKDVELLYTLAAMGRFLKDSLAEDDGATDE